MERPEGNQEENSPGVILFAYSPTYRPYDKLSNLFPCSFIYQGVAYRSAEHALQCGKAMNQKDFNSIRDASSAIEAKKLGDSIPKDRSRPNWDIYCLSRMHSVLLCKFTQLEYQRQVLVSTGKAQLIHASAGDKFWGSGPDGKGENRLGKMLMEIRSEFQEQLEERVHG